MRSFFRGSWRTFWGYGRSNFIHCRFKLFGCFDFFAVVRVIFLVNVHILNLFTAISMPNLYFLTSRRYGSIDSIYCALCLLFCVLEDLLSCLFVLDYVKSFLEVHFKYYCLKDTKIITVYSDFSKLNPNSKFEVSFSLK